MKRTTFNSLNLKESIKTLKECDKTYLYVLRPKEGGDIFYVGITSDIKSTKNRHTVRENHVCPKLEVIGTFMDRKLAEFFEIKLIEACIYDGLDLENKVVAFSNYKNDLS